MSHKYERGTDLNLTSNGQRDAHLDAIALLEAQLGDRRGDMNRLLTDAGRVDLIALTDALISVGAEAIYMAAGSPTAILGLVRRRTIEISLDCRL
jgi:hypothetical protein